MTTATKMLRPGNATASFNVLQDIVDDGWIDASTREVIVDYTTFNIELEVYSIGSLRFLYTKAGGVRAWNAQPTIAQQIKMLDAACTATTVAEALAEARGAHPRPQHASRAAPATPHMTSTTLSHRTCALTLALAVPLTFGPDALTHSP